MRTVSIKCQSIFGSRDDGRWIDTRGSPLVLPDRGTDDDEEQESQEDGQQNAQNDLLISG